MKITGLSKSYIVWLVLIGLFPWYGHAQPQAVNITEVDSLMEQQAKPILILLSTDWCTYCQMQQHQLQKNPDFAEHGDLFYFISFDAESKADVSFQGQPYSFRPTGKNTGTHELARALNGPGTLAFPTWVLLDQQYRVLFRHGGVLTAKQLKKLLDAIAGLQP